MVAIPLDRGDLSLPATRPTTQATFRKERTMDMVWVAWLTVIPHAEHVAGPIYTDFERHEARRSRNVEIARGPPDVKFPPICSRRELLFSE